MNFVSKKNTLLKSMLVVSCLLCVETTFAENSTDDKFVDQMNGMTRLTRLELKNSLKSDQVNFGQKMPDSIFIQKMFAGATSDRLVSASVVKRGSVFHNGRKRSLQATRRTIAPSGLFRLCADKTLVVCNKNSGNLQLNADGKVLMNRHLINSLQQVNIEINKQIKPENEKLGAKDNWQVNLAKGDCEDYALTKKTELIAQGWPSKALMITIVDTEYGERHAVLMVSTNHGEYILDNLMNKVINVEISKYRFISRQGLNEGFSWNILA